MASDRMGNFMAGFLPARMVFWMPEASVWMSLDILGCFFFATL